MTVTVRLHGKNRAKEVAPARTAVRQIHQNLKALPNNFVALLAMHVNDKAHPAGIVFERRVVQTLSAPWIVRKL